MPILALQILTIINILVSVLSLFSTLKTFKAKYKLSLKLGSLVISAVFVANSYVVYSCLAMQ